MVSPRGSGNSEALFALNLALGRRGDDNLIIRSHLIQKEEEYVCLCSSVFFIFNFISPFLSFIALHQQHLTSLCVLVHHHLAGAVDFG